MNFVCIGGDHRQIETAIYLQSLGHTVSVFGLPRTNELQVEDNLYNAINGKYAVILPLPLSRDGVTVNTPLTDDVIFIEDVLLCKPNIIFAGLIKPDIKEKLESRNIEFCDYYDSEALTVRNAVLTAEAAIAIAINCTDFSIFGSKSLVLGYGRIGRQLARYLKSLGSVVTATSRHDGVLAVIEADGFNAVNTLKTTEICGEFDYIFNTAPSPILNKKFLNACKSSVFIEDLATDSGIDLSSARELNVNAAVYSGLPGKHSPVSAAKSIAKEILLYLEMREIYAK